MATSFAVNGRGKEKYRASVWNSLPFCTFLGYDEYTAGCDAHLQGAAGCFSGMRCCAIENAKNRNFYQSEKDGSV
jgi:hypothetical protein